MATTKIWDVSAHASKLLAYVANKNKTTMEVERGTDDEEMRLAAEALGLSSDHFDTEEKKFVAGINCTPENANEVMLTLLEGVSPTSIQAYHGYQSFKPGEVTPDVSHAIGGSQGVYPRASSLGREFESDRREGEHTRLCG